MRYLSSMLLAGPGWQVLTTLAAAVTRNSCPISISKTASVCPGLASGMQVGVPVVVRVVNQKNRSWGKVSPCDPKNGPACSAPSAW